MAEKDAGKSPPKSPPPRPPALQATCPDAVGDPPSDWESQLPRAVPPVEGPPATSPPSGKMPPSPWPAGPAKFSWYLPLPLAGAYPTGVFIPKDFSYEKYVDVILFFHGNKRGP